MRKLLLLDADVTIDLHTLDLFGIIRKAYDICLTMTVFEEAKYYKKSGAKIVGLIDVSDCSNLSQVKGRPPLFNVQLMRMSSPTLGGKGERRYTGMG